MVQTSSALKIYDDTWGRDPVILEKINGVPHLRAKGKITQLDEVLVYTGRMGSEWYLVGNWEFRFSGFSQKWEWAVQLDHRGEWVGKVSAITFGRNFLGDLVNLCSL